MDFDKDNITDRVLKKIGQYVAQTDFQPEIIGRVSLAAKSLCMWVSGEQAFIIHWHFHLKTKLSANKK